MPQLLSSSPVFTTVPAPPSSTEVANDGDRVGMVLNSLCAALYLILGCAALFRLVHKHRKEHLLCSTVLRWVVVCRMPWSSSRRCCCCCCCSSSSGNDDDANADGDESAPAAPPGAAGSSAAPPPPPYYHQRHRNYMSSSVPSATTSATTASGGKQRKGYLVLLTLLVYAALRSSQLILFATGKVDSSGDLETHMYTFLPALAFMALQSAILIKWVDHVSELTLALQNHPFRVGSFLITCSLLMLVVEAVLTVLAFTDVEVRHFSAQPSRFWNVLVNMFCGVVYAFNGSSFACLGLFLRWLWVPLTEDSVMASRRILGIALGFGVMCVARGAILCMYLEDGSSGDVQSVTHNQWGAPAVLLFEWVSLVVSLLLLTEVRSSDSEGGSASSADRRHPTPMMIGSGRVLVVPDGPGALGRSLPPVSPHGHSQHNNNNNNNNAAVRSGTLSDVSMASHHRGSYDDGKNDTVYYQKRPSGPDIAPAGPSGFGGVYTPSKRLGGGGGPTSPTSSYRRDTADGSLRAALLQQVVTATSPRNGGGGGGSASGSYTTRQPPNVIQGGSIRSLHGE